MRIINSEQLHRGMVLTLHYPQTHPHAGVNAKPFDTENIVIIEVLDDRFRAVKETKARGCSKHHDSQYHFSDFQIVSKAVPELRLDACCWMESTGEKTEEEVQAMLNDDCLRCV